MDKFKNLSEKQKKIVFDGKGKFTVRAIAGSGKTYVVAARIAKLLDQWKFKSKGINIISFTNIACKEIDFTLTSKFSVHGISHPHYLGTFDSFINKFIFLPFGNKILGINHRPKLVGEPFGHWHGKNFGQTFFENISYNINGELYFINSRNKPKPDYIYLANNQKKILTKAGFATQTDANYFALEILKKFPAIAKSIVNKFPYFIVDEAQDLSDIQMAIIDKLIENGLNEVMFVGDPDQAIYEWRNSLPELFVKKTIDWAESSFMLDDSRRSSQLICDFSFKISSLQKMPLADNPDKNSEIKPTIVIYELNEIKKMADTFIEECLAHGIEVSPNKVAIIFRSAGLYNEFAENGQKNHIFDWTVENDLFEISKAKYLFENGQVREAIMKAKKIYVRNKLRNAQASSEEIDKYIEDFGYMKFNISLINIMKSIPNIAQNKLSKWATDSADVLLREFNILSSKYKKKYKDLALSENFKLEIPQKTYKGCHLSTIHKVKGETYDAVLVILKSKGIGKAYVNLLNEGIETYKNEELRNVYVAVTRPRLFLKIGVPSKRDFDSWNKRFFLK